VRAAAVAHFDETGFRVAGRLAWVHSASSGNYVLVTAHARRGKDGMDAAGVLPAFTGTACHDAWGPHDCYQDLAGHALCNAHLLRELNAVTETGTADDVTWARQATDALLALKKAAGEARSADRAAISAQALGEHSGWFHQAAAAGTALNAARRTAMQKKRHALAARMTSREADYLRFASDLRVPFDNKRSRARHPDEQAPHQGFRLHALHERRRELLHHPHLPRHCKPPRHQLARRPHPGRPGQPLDSADRIDQPGNTASGTRAEIGTYPVTTCVGLSCAHGERALPVSRAIGSLASARPVPARADLGSQEGSGRCRNRP
jgi:hypothetical protein